MNKDIKEIFKLIKKYETITIFGHINPDGDCYGSSLALRELIRLNFPHKKVYSLAGTLPQLEQRLAKQDLVEDDELIKNSLAILVDVSETERVSDQRVNLAKQIIKIDHHIESKPFYGIKWVDEDSIAACQMIAELAFSCRLKINKLIAELLYLGICTDSGRFRYQPTNSKTHRIIADLLEYGVETDSIFKILYLSDETYVKYQALLVSKFERTEHNVIYCFADVEDYTQFGLKFDQISKNVNVIGNIRGCPIWVLFTRSPENFIRVEFRSTGVNVQKVAAKYGGGGHLHAAGARLDNQKDFSLAMKIVEDLDQAAAEAIGK